MRARFPNVPLALSAVLLACADPGPRRLAVAATLSPTTIAVGGSTSISLEFTNLSTRTVQVVADACLQQFEVLNTDGVVVGPGPRICALALMAPTTVAPGASWTLSDTWAGDSLGTTATGHPNLLHAGTYFIRPRMMVLEAGFTYGESIPITITPP